MILFAVSILRSYDCCGEQYFGTEGVFLSQDDAKKFIQQEIADIVSGTNTDDHETFFGEDNAFADEVFYTNDYITSAGHKFQWDISPITLKNSVKQKIFDTVQHENDVEYIKKTIEYFDDLLYDHIRDIPCTTMQRMAALKRRKQEDRMTELDAAIAAVRETVGWN